MRIEILVNSKGTIRLIVCKKTIPVDIWFFWKTCYKIILFVGYQMDLYMCENNIGTWSYFSVSKIPFGRLYKLRMLNIYKI